MYIRYYDLRVEPLEEGQMTELGDAIKLRLNSDGRFEVRTDLAYEVVLILNKEDQKELRDRLNELHQKAEERKVKRLAREKQKAQT